MGHSFEFEVLAGNQYPDKRFPRSVTFGALLNVVDYMEEEESARAARLIDQMLKSFACHTFRGSIIAPQARIYRSVILPFTQSAQFLIHLLNAETPVGNSEWMVFLMNSKYRLPHHYASLMDEPLEMEYQTGNAWVKLKKQQDYMLTSVQSPRYDENPSFWENSGFDDSADVESNSYIKSFNERFHGTSHFEPGVHSYQQHMWYAALDNDTVVFTNHPGRCLTIAACAQAIGTGTASCRQSNNRAICLAPFMTLGKIILLHLPICFFRPANLIQFYRMGNGCLDKRMAGTQRYGAAM
ncbi:hypothetical protein L1N85_08705 [Paenibacillus alkaliterrae]|uniref:hypothetical protein n=1 Tax=Paenibacillus alkaliterrae TaxID=320909 RepID=UPI001F1F50D2|nr:hypothetical protein [Paenibacillus alkaliterrae]MCF2938513.1 hypothetical protein [Paenibacillus alkaliterrae]